MGDGRNRTACLGNGVKNVKRIEQPENAITVKSIRFLYKEISGFAVTVMCCSSCFRMVLKESASVGKLLRKCNEQKLLNQDFYGNYARFLAFTTVKTYTVVFQFMTSCRWLKLDATFFCTVARL